MGAGSECGDGDAEDSNPIEVLPSYKLDLQRPVVLGGAAGARAGPPPPSHMLASPSKAARASSTGRAELSRTVHFAEIQMVFSAREDGTVAFWDVHSERARAEVHHLRAHKGPVMCVLCLERETDSEIAVPLVLTGSADASIKVWDPMVVRQCGNTKPAPCIQTMVGHGGTVTALTRVGAYVFSCSTDCKVILWRAAGDREATLYPWFEQQRVMATFDGWVNSVHYSITAKVGDMGAVFAADSTGAVVKFQPQLPKEAAVGDRAILEFAVVNSAGKAVSTSPPPLQFRRLVSGRGLSHVLFLAEEGLVLTLAYDNKMRLYDERAAQLSAQLENPHACSFSDVAYDTVHRQVLLVDQYGFLFVFDIAREKLVFEERLMDKAFVAVCYNTATDEVGITTKDSVAWWKLIRDVEYSALPSGHTGPVFALQVAGLPSSPGNNDENDGGYVFSCSLDNTVRVWDPYDMMCLRLLQEDRSELSAMGYCESKKTLVTGHDNGCVRLWNLDTGSTINMTHHSNTVSCIICATLKRGEEFVLTGSFDGKVGIWDVRKKSTVRPHLVSMFEAHPHSEVLCLLYDEHKRTIITSGNDAVIQVWNALTFESVGQHVGHEEGVTCLALDANFLFSGSEDTTIRVWDSLAIAPSTEQGLPSRARRTHIKTLTGHSRPITGMTMLEDTGHLLSTSLDGTLRVWNYTLGVVIKQFEHRDEMRCLAYRMDTNKVLVGTGDDSILVYALPEETRQSRRSSRAVTASIVSDDDGDRGGEPL